MDFQDVQSLASSVQRNIEKVMIGQEKTIRLVLTAVLSGGHVLLEDVPGTGKTTLAKALAVSLGGTFARVQCTPDLLPADITGMQVFQMQTGEFVFHKGPVFSHVLLTDEINRATPRTQSALLECMEEAQVTEDGKTYPLPAPFFVIATQNPVESAGTFVLPEAQMDRFLMQLTLGYPDTDGTVSMLKRFQNAQPMDTLQSVITPQHLQEAQRQCRTCFVHDDILRYIALLCEKARDTEKVRLGPSPRSALALMRAAQSYAAMEGRGYVIPDDVQLLAPPVLAHRIMMRGVMQKVSAADFLKDVLSTVPVPTERDGMYDRSR